MNNKLKIGLLTFLALEGIAYLGLIISGFYTNNNLPSYTKIASKEVIKKAINPSYSPIILTSNLCDQETDQVKKERCNNQIIANDASYQGDKSICNNIINQYDKEMCLYYFLRQEKDFKACNVLTIKKVKEACIGDIGIFTRNQKACNFLKEEGDLDEFQECQDRTMAFVAGDLKNPQICGDLKTMEYSGLCRRNAMKSSGMGCEELTDKANREACTSEVLYQNAKTREDCEKIPADNFRKVCLAIFDHANDPNWNFDSDNDGMNDTTELWIGTDPFTPNPEITQKLKEESLYTR